MLNDGELTSSTGSQNDSWYTTILPENQMIWRKMCNKIDVSSYYPYRESDIILEDCNIDDV